MNPTATTCGELSARSVVSMARCRSVRNANASLVSRVVAFAIGSNLAQDIIATMEDTADNRLVVVFGGRSEIGIELATRLAAGATVVLAARNVDRLTDEVAAVTAAGAAAVHVREFDADALASHAPLVDSIVTEFGPIATAVVAFGILGDQARAEADSAHAAAIVHTDYTAQVSLLTVLAATMRTAGRGAIVVFSSVAGARPRRANYVYGSAKSGLDAFARGLTDALHGSGVRLLLVRPGFVIGRMTEGMSPAPLSSTPTQVADAVAGALAKGRNEIWVPRSLGVLVLALKLMPRAMWRRLPR